MNERRSSTKNRRTGLASAIRDGAPPEPDLDEATELVMSLLAIAGRSGEEAEVAEFVRRTLRRAGVPNDMIATDRAWKKTPIDGKTGNLIVRLPGTVRAPRRLLMAHMDTVPICVGSRPVRKVNQVRSADPRTGLGADDRAGTAVVLQTAIEVVRRRLPHPPLTFLWTVQEEVGLYGARNVGLASLGKVRLAFNWDGGAADKLTVGATGGYRMQIELFGLASHAGGAPQEGISAIAIAALAIAELHREGWHGDIRQQGKSGTSNVGVITGGAATNVVTDRVTLRAEARSHDPKFRAAIVKRIEKAFRDAARQVKNVRGQTGRAEFAGHLDYEAFRLPNDEPCVQRAAEAVASLGLEPQFAVANGGLDANWMTARGIPTVSLGCGQRHIHTVHETLDLREYHRACRIALRLATDTTDH